MLFRSWTPLHLACLKGHTETALALIANKAEVNCVDKYGETPIQFAVVNNHIAVINILFEAGADVSCLDQEFINKYNTKIKQETRDLITKITQPKINKTPKRKKQMAEASKRYYAKKKSNNASLKVAFITSFIINIILIIFNII